MTGTPDVLDDDGALDDLADLDDLPAAAPVAVASVAVSGSVRGRGAGWSERERQVTCPECGESRYVSARTARGIESGEMVGRCVDCRHPNLNAITPEQARALAHWWLGRYTDGELADLADALGVPGASAENVAASRARLLGDRDRASTADIGSSSARRSSSTRLRVSSST